MPYVQREGCRLNYVVEGNPRAPALLFSNSLGSSHELWAPQVEGLSSSFRLIRYDTRGHGASSVPDGPYGIEMLGLDALAVLDAAGVSRAHVCGLSLGGLTAMWLGVHASTRVETLVLANTAARIRDAQFWQERMEAVRASGLGPLVEASMSRWFTDRFRSASPEVVARHGRMLASSPAAGYIACCGVLRDADLRGALSGIAAPTLIITGTHDPVTPPADADAIRTRIPGARVTVLDAAHLSNVEQAELFNRRILEFISEKGPAHG